MEKREEVSDEINLIDYINVIKKHSRMIVIIIALSVLTTGTISFLMPKIYETKAVIARVTPQPKEPVGMDIMAAQLGIITPTPADLSEIANLLKSNILLEKIITKYDLLKVFFREGSLKGSKDEMMWEGIRYFRSIMKVNHKQRENIIELSVQFKDPRIAADIINYTIAELAEHMIGEAKRVTEINIKHLESLVNKISDPLIKQRLYALIAQQKETSLMAEVKENFAFRVIDPPMVPHSEIKPKIKMNIMLSFVASLFVGIFLAFFREYLKKNAR